MKACFIPILFLPFFSSAQKSELNLTIGAGPGYFFSKNPYPGMLDFTRVMGVNLVLGGNKNILFNPGMNYYVNNYKSRLEENGLAFVSQRMFGFNTDVLMKVTRHNYLRVGLFLNTMNYSVLEVRYELQNGTRHIFGNPQIYESYSSNNLQAGFVTGMCFPFNVSGFKFRFNVNVFQNASSIVLYDYYVSNSVGDKVKVISGKALPTKLMFLLDFNLRPRVKSKKDFPAN